ncbi:hypothetical protein B0J15DRAFT_517206 [Fusarium solani]|uniref:PD-(D/E)XK nuclease-like domain-containing protein n=1 Tax=Fusarium solani TaxID=169388 RepID=A0A9P9G8Z2_FUSSL|nr:uncharacterized protein B0J15DRAFT_517206 [Fusarium solani]KAH7234215.1 hypothetical protein B0J15DRAFT_517206 [Fusarium solani]
MHLISCPTVVRSTRRDATTTNILSLERGVEGGYTPRASRKKVSLSRVLISTSSSPSRRLDSLSLYTDGIILKWIKWKGILGLSMRKCLDDAYSKESDDYGSTLSLSAVDEILDYARQRFEKSYLEMVWNFEVYYCLLGKVFRVGERPYLVDVILWYDAKPPLYPPTGNANTSTSHSATITKKYLPTTLIDFCIYVNPGADVESGENYADRANGLRRSLLMLCINHISYLGLKAELISISLETKRSGDDEDNATLKIDTWQAAQWNYLKYLLQNGEHSSPFHQPPRLPTQWHFFTCTDSQQILWARFPFGDTTSLAGVYTIATVVQYLRHWTATWYWEWFKRSMLDIIHQSPI